MTSPAHEVKARLAGRVLIAEEAQPCTRGDCDEESHLIVEVGIALDDGDSGEGQFPLCREHLHDFIDFIVEKGHPA